MLLRQNTNSIAIGEDSSSTNAESIALGFNAATTASNQLMIGASTDNLNTYIYGTLETSNNVGVGVTPTDPLHILTDAGGDAIHIEENSGGEDWQLGVDATGDLNFEDEGTTRVEFLDGGNVNVTGGNVTVQSTYSLCFNAECTARIYHDGSSLIIEGQ